MEVVAFLTLAVAGYIVNKRRRAKGPLHTGFHIPREDATAYEGDDMYESRQFKRAMAIEKEAAARSYAQGMLPEQSGVISRSFTDDSVQAGMVQRRRNPIGIHQDKQGYSQLSGLPTDFAHTNMLPFFGSTVRQNQSNPALLERFTGVTAEGEKPRAAKVERVPMFASQPIGNVFGAPSSGLAEAIDRLPVQRFKNNDLPFKQVTVGPSIGGGFTSTPGDSYLTGRQYQFPKDVDELRTADNPRVTFEGRTIAGAERIQERGELGAVDEPRYPQRYRETFSSDDWMKTTGQNLGEASRPEQILRDVLRPEMHVPYTGSAGPTSLTSASYTGQGDQSEPHRSEGMHLHLGPAAAAMAADRAAATRADFGRANILVYANERDTTSIPVFAGSSSTVVKSIIAPLLDMMRPARRQVLGTDAARVFGNISTTFPDKQTVRDPDGILRTTIRETTQQYTAAPGALGSLKGPTLLPVYDPADIAKTTLKEQTIHDGAGPSHTVPAPGQRRTSARDPDDHSRTTVRQTLDNTNTSVNPSMKSKGQLLRDPELHMRDTVRQTTVSAGNAETDGTAVGGVQGLKGGYTSADMTRFATTTREFTQDDGHLGTAGTTVMTTGDGYCVANAVPRDTQRQVLSDNSYYGVGRQQGAGDAQTSHEEYEHATIRPDKEILAVMERSSFNPSGNKEAVGKSAVEISDPRKFPLDVGFEEWTPPVGRIMPQPTDAASLGFPEVGADNTGGLDSREGTRGLRGTYEQEMAMPVSRFDEDIKAMNVARSSNPTANSSFSGR